MGKRFLISLLGLFCLGFFAVSIYAYRNYRMNLADHNTLTLLRVGAYHHLLSDLTTMKTSFKSAVFTKQPQMAKKQLLSAQHAGIAAMRHIDFLHLYESNRRFAYQFLQTTIDQSDRWLSSPQRLTQLDMHMLNGWTKKIDQFTSPIKKKITDWNHRKEAALFADDSIIFPVNQPMARSNTTFPSPKITSQQLIHIRQKVKQLFHLTELPITDIKKYEPSDEAPYYVVSFRDVMVALRDPSLTLLWFDDSRPPSTHPTSLSLVDEEQISLGFLQRLGIHDVHMTQYADDLGRFTLRFSRHNGNAIDDDHAITIIFAPKSQQIARYYATPYYRHEVISKNFASRPMVSLTSILRDFNQPVRVLSARLIRHGKKQIIGTQDEYQVELRYHGEDYMAIIDAHTGNQLMLSAVNPT
nr:hypothetical protein [Bacilli bacterium]